MSLLNANINDIVATTIELRSKDVADSVKNALKTVPTQLQFTLKPVTGGPFVNEYDIDVSPLKVPAMINLEAAS